MVTDISQAAGFILFLLQQSKRDKKSKLEKLTSLNLTERGFSKQKTEIESYKFTVDSRVINTQLFQELNLTEWKIVIDICNKLKYCNALWKNEVASVNNNSQRLALNKLISMKVLIKTEIRHIYIVNPYFIRYGEYYSVLYSTLSIIKTNFNENSHLIAKPISKYDE